MDYATKWIWFSITGVIFLFAGIGMIIGGAVQLGSVYSTGTWWALLWIGVGLVIIGSTFMGVARRMRYWAYCGHPSYPTVTISPSAQYVATTTTQQQYVVHPAPYQPQPQQGAYPNAPSYGAPYGTNFNTNYGQPPAYPAPGMPQPQPQMGAPPPYEVAKNH